MRVGQGWWGVVVGGGSLGPIVGTDKISNRIAVFSRKH